MKKSIYMLVSISMLLSCKKESSSPTNNSTSNNSNTVACMDNPNINFTCVGTPIGKFSDCIKDVDGNTYKTVTIGTQTWMAENLKTSKYNDGTSIPNVTDAKQWTELTTGAWCNYNNSDSLGKIYGKLYNWFAVSPTTNGYKNVCPTGWHVPTDAEWTILIDYLGGDSIAGGKMREVGTKSWNSPNTGATNTSLFSAIPGGGRGWSGNYMYSGDIVFYWSSTEYNTGTAWAQIQQHTEQALYLSFKDNENKKIGGSIRCLRD